MNSTRIVVTLLCLVPTCVCFSQEPDLNKPEEARNRSVTNRNRRPPGEEFAGRPVTVSQLEEEVKRQVGRRDGAAEKDLYRLQLTERLSTARLATLKAQLSGAKTRAALTELADASAFLNLPADEIPATPKPDIPEQRHILALAVDYLSKTIPRLPNFYALRTTVRYEDTVELANNSAVSVASNEPMREAGASTASVIYRDHQEVVDATPGKKRAGYDAALMTRGTFGPILSTSIVDAAHGVTTFSHWEQGAGGLEAVFKFKVAKDQSHYLVAYARSGMGSQAPEQSTAYHGEIALDPATGTILRLALVSDPELDSPMLQANVMVEYGQVEIGGKQYTCPVKSVSLLQGRAALPGYSYSFAGRFTRINDVAFSDYHMFRTEMRLITDDSQAAPQKP